MYGCKSFKRHLALTTIIGLCFFQSETAWATNIRKSSRIHRISDTLGLRANRQLQDEVQDEDIWKAEWWADANDFSPETNETVKEKMPGNDGEKVSTQRAESTSSSAEPSEESSAPFVGTKAFKVYEMMLYFLFVGGNKIPESSRESFESITSEHIADIIGEKCAYGFRNLIVKVTMEDQFNNTEFIQISEKAYEGTNSIEKTEKAANTIKAIIYVVVEGQAKSDLTREDLILGSFFSDEKSSRYLTALTKLSDEYLTGIESLKVASDDSVEALFSPEEEISKSGSNDEASQETSNNTEAEYVHTEITPVEPSDDSDSPGTSFVLGICILAIAVSGVVVLLIIRGPLQENLNRFKKRKTGHKIVNKRDTDEVYEVEYVDNCDVSTLSRSSYYSADFHNNPKSPTPSVAKRLKERLRKQKEVVMNKNNKLKKTRLVPGKTIPGPPQEAFSKISTDVRTGTEIETQGSSEEETIIFELEAPAGMLGIVVESPDHTGPTVHQIRDSSPFYGQVEVGDKLISVDDEDTTQMSAIRASKLISYKSNQKTRKLVFKRIQGIQLT